MSQKKHTSFSPIQWQSQNPKPAKRNTYCPLLSGGWDRNGKKMMQLSGPAHDLSYLFSTVFTANDVDYNGQQYFKIE